MSSPVPSPVRFIISSSAAVSARVYPLARAKITEVSSLWVCSSGPTSISSTIAWMRPALRRIAELFVLRPFVRHRTRHGHHPLQHRDLAIHRLARRAGQSRRLFRQRADEFAALLGEQFDAVGGEQLVVADRGGDRARARPRCAQSRLHVVIAVAAGLERIDPHRLLARQPGCRRDAGIGALELDFAGRPLRRRTGNVPTPPSVDRRRQE